MKTGNTHLCPTLDLAPLRPQWSPVMKTGNTRAAPPVAPVSLVPQWSPVMKTGNTRTRALGAIVNGRLNGARS